MTPKQRWTIIGGVLLATLAAAYFAEDETAPDEGKSKVAKSARQIAPTPTGESRRAGKDAPNGELAAAPLSFPEPVAAKPAEAGEEKAGEDKNGEDKGEVAAIIDPFRNKSWFIAPPPPPVRKPVAPALPFQYLGKLVEDGEQRIFLNHQGKYLIAKVGDVINETYSVEEIAGGRMTFLYQPLNEKQVLNIGDDK